MGRSSDSKDNLINESTVETATQNWMEALDWQVVHGADIDPDSPTAERSDYEQVVLKQRLLDSISTLNPDLPTSALNDAFRKLTHPEGATVESRNRSFHRMLVDGVNIEYGTENGVIRGVQVQVIDFHVPSKNDWLAVRQLWVKENGSIRRPDVTLFVNGLPIGIIELKNPMAENATIWTAWQQLQTYKSELPTLFSLNEILIVSDGNLARVGTLTAGKEWFKPWREISADLHSGTSELELKVMLDGVCAHLDLLRLIRDFIVFEDDGSGSLVKKMAGYHQYHAVHVAVYQTRRATERQWTVSRVAEESGIRYDAAGRSGGEAGDRRIGVVWHTQGSGKSLTMAFYSGATIREPAMSNPTIVVLTDRLDLDEQLFSTFSRCQDLLRQPPVQATDRADLQTKLSVESGGVVFTTIQKFFPDEKGDIYPVLSDRRNIVVIADEAHRSQYDFIDGFAAHMRNALPNASFVGFTGTPIELRDANTRAVFGDYISIYDVQRSVEDGATVPIYYESRLARLTLDEATRPNIDPEFEELTENEELDRKERLKSRWAQLEAIVGTRKRLRTIAEDLISHFEKRMEVLDGKAMIVCMSRRICVDLYRELVQLQPSWHSDDDSMGEIKVVMTGSATDPLDWQPHIRSKSGREALAQRFRDANDSLRIVLVRDMWLTGFDAPCLHTMYVDKPMRDHGLMQAIARVNRVFRDKPGGLIVDYLGLAHELKSALNTYTESGGTGKTAIDQADAVAEMQTRYEICLGLFHGFDWSNWIHGNAQDKLGLLPPAQEHILAQKDGKDRYIKAVRELSQAFALAVPHEDALKIHNDVGFFQAVQAALVKQAKSDPRTDAELDFAIRRIASRAVLSEGVIDVFDAAGLEKPDISVLSDEFLAEVRGMPQRNLAVETLQKLIKGEISTRRKKNVVQARSFAQMLEQALRKYQNRTIETAQVIEELIALAHEMREANERGEQLGLTEDELAFYDALETNHSAVEVLGDEKLRKIARELVETVRKNVTIDWTIRENVRAHLRVLVKRILRKYGYPPDRQDKATATVLEQAELLSADWAA